MVAVVVIILSVFYYLLLINTSIKYNCLLFCFSFQQTRGVPRPDLPPPNRGANGHCLPEPR